MSTDETKFAQKPRALKAVEKTSEAFLFGSRWLLAPMYVGLVVGLVVILVKFFQGLWELVFGSADGRVPGMLEGSPHDIVLGLLSLLDLALLGNLILIVIFAGYENFVSKMAVARNAEDRPRWMGHVDFSGLKIKLIGSLVAISVIELLQDFMKAGEEELDFAQEAWRIGLHLTFVVSGVLFALMDYLADKRKALYDPHGEAPDSGI